MRASANAPLVLLRLCANTRQLECCLKVYCFVSIILILRGERPLDTSGRQTLIDDFNRLLAAKKDLALCEAFATKHTLVGVVQSRSATPRTLTEQHCGFVYRRPPVPKISRRLHLPCLQPAFTRLKCGATARADRIDAQDRLAGSRDRAALRLLS